MKPRPNILCIVTDQQHPDLLGSVGRYPLKTPNLDALAEGGARFTRAYTSCPVCTPTRATLLTGQYPSRHRAWSIGTDTPEDALSLPGLLAEKAGYATAMIGKSHLRSCMREGSFEALPHNQDWDFFREWTGPWYGFEYAKLNTGHASEPHSYSMHYGLHLHENGIPFEEPYFNFDPNPGANTEPLDIPLELHNSIWCADEAIKYLQGKEDDDRPFYMSLNFADPHCPYRAPEPYYSMYDDCELPPPKRIANEDNGTSVYRYSIDPEKNDYGWDCGPGLPCQAGQKEQSLKRNEFEERAWRSYMGMQTLVDEQVGRVIQYLKDNDLFDNTLIVYTSDHGDYMGDHHLWSKGGSHYDGGVRVPFIVSWPKHIPKGQINDQLVSLVDLPATFMTAAGLSPHVDMQGTVQLDTFADSAVASRSGVWIDNRVESCLTVNSWVTDRYRLSIHSIHGEGRDEVELYDLQEDLDEYRNIAKEQPELVNKLMMEMLRYQQSVNGPWQKREAFG